MKKYSRIGALLLSLVLMFSLITCNLYAIPAPVASAKKFANQEVVAQELPKPEDMYIDRDNYDRQVLLGYYNFNCYVNKDLTRTAKFYIPAKSVINQPTVIVVVPSGVNTWQFLVDSGWKQTADQEGIFIVLAEPDQSGQWGSLSTESSYLTELCADVTFRPYFCAFEAAIYSIGYGDGAAILQENALSKPNRYAAISLVGAPGISASKVTYQQTTNSSMAGVKLSQVQLPIWIVAESNTDDVKRLVDYFKSANHSKSIPTDPETEFADSLYMPMAGGNIDEEWCAKVFSGIGNWQDYLTPGFSGNVFRKLFSSVRRYPGNGINFLRSYEDIYKAGFKKFTGYVSGGFEEDGSDQYNRTWYVYKPKSVKSNQSAPVVFVFHGAGGSGDEIADRSGWKKVADKYGIILIAPTGSHVLTPRNTSNMWTTELMRAMWNTDEATTDRPSDLKFVEYLYDWAKKNYNIDTKRVYAAGQSSGGAMTYACTLFLPKLFAASMPTSALANWIDMSTSDYSHIFDDVDESSIVPVINFIGEKDNYFEGKGFGHPGGKATIDYFVNRYMTVEDYSTYTYQNGGQNSTYRDGLFNNYVFKTPDGVPLFRGVEVTTSGHAIWPSECFTAWEEFFTKYTKDSSGSLFFEGKLVEIE